MKKLYEAPKLEMMILVATDIVTASIGSGTGSGIDIGYNESDFTL